MQANAASSGTVKTKASAQRYGRRGPAIDATSVI